MFKFRCEWDDGLGYGLITNRGYCGAMIKIILNCYVILLRSKNQIIFVYSFHGKIDCLKKRQLPNFNLFPSTGVIFMSIRLREDC